MSNQEIQQKIEKIRIVLNEAIDAIGELAIESKIERKRCIVSIGFSCAKVFLELEGEDSITEQIRKLLTKYTPLQNVVVDQIKEK